jgi:exopolyphosphatase/guanosine-5'-triphosphate,3'-diphosphate pyrophosphatase
MKFAAIDVGSNAIRLLFSRVEDETDQPFFEKVSLLRIPLRLGDDAFINKKISEEKTDKLVELMQAFRHLINVYQPIEYMAYATSAMRESKNHKKIVNRIKKECDIELQVIEGKKEAKVIYSNHIEKILDRNGSYLYIDVGGGSTEITFFKGKHAVRSRSFNIGTIRIKEGLVSKRNWKRMKKWIKDTLEGEENVCAIGTGGNINKLFKHAEKKEGKPLKYKKLKKTANYLGKFTVEERIIKFNMKPDRADVIVPASKVYLSAMKWGNINKIYVPKIGLVDGMVHVMYKKHKENFV